MYILTRVQWGMCLRSGGDEGGFALQIGVSLRRSLIEFKCLISRFEKAGMLLGRMIYWLIALECAKSEFYSDEVLYNLSSGGVASV